MIITSTSPSSGQPELFHRKQPETTLEILQDLLKPVATLEARSRNIKLSNDFYLTHKSYAVPVTLDDALIWAQTFQHYHFADFQQNIYCPIDQWCDYPNIEAWELRSGALIADRYCKRPPIRVQQVLSISDLRIKFLGVYEPDPAGDIEFRNFEVNLLWRFAYLQDSNGIETLEF